MHISVSKSQPVDHEFSVPQGSIYRSVLYTIYASILQHFIKNSGVSLLGYADDHSAYDSFKPKTSDDEKHVIKHLNLNLNRLKLNPTNTEFVLIGSQLSEYCVIF